MEKDKEKTVRQLLDEICKNCEALNAIDDDFGVFMLANRDYLSLGMAKGKFEEIAIGLAVMASKSPIVKTIIIDVADFLKNNELTNISKN